MYFIVLSVLLSVVINSKVLAILLVTIQQFTIASIFLYLS